MELIVSSCAQCRHRPRARALSALMEPAYAMP